MEIHWFPEKGEKSIKNSEGNNVKIKILQVFEKVAGLKTKLNNCQGYVAEGMLNELNFRRK